MHARQRVDLAAFDPCMTSISMESAQLDIDGANNQIYLNDSRAIVRHKMGLQAQEKDRHFHRFEVGRAPFLVSTS